MNTVDGSQSQVTPWWQGLWDVLRLPVRILAFGSAVFLVVWLATFLPLGDLKTGFEKLMAAVTGDQLANTVVGILVCAVGLSFAVFLWWVVDRFFVLISSGKLSADSLSSMQSLPLGLPEGTIRSILALMVAVIGLPILLFSKVMHLDESIAGYVNGIITGVFGFYFGTRSGSAQNQVGQVLDQLSDAHDKLADANAQVQQAQGERDAAQADVGAARQDVAAAKADAANAQAQAQSSQDSAAAARRSANFDSTLSKAARQASIASTVLDVIVPALPPGMLPAGVAGAVSATKTALDSVKGVTKDTATSDQAQMLENAVGALTGAIGGGGNSALGALVSKAAPMLSMVGLSGVTPVSALVMLLSLGAKLGSAEYQRWRARVLAAPLATGLVEFGTLTPDEAHAALLDAPIFAKAFSEEKARPGFDADLADAVLRDNALDRLWDRYGGGTPGHPALFTDRAQLQAGLLEFQQVLLASRSAGDIPDALPGALSASLATAANPAFRPGSVNRDSLNQIVNAASKASASGTAPTESHAAFDALVTLVGHARHDNVDIVKALSEVAP